MSFNLTAISKFGVFTIYIRLFPKHYLEYSQVIEINMILYPASGFLIRGLLYSKSRINHHVGLVKRRNVENAIGNTDAMGYSAF
jgi:hypothetical protein